MALDDYRRKRSFDQTPEPSDTAVTAYSARRFCLQRHDASRLHYDFRLELNGVLKSWAVPKGPSLAPSDKRLAVATEDHPLGYLDWEGIIPAGQYGGGVVMVFDLGDWEPVEAKEPEQSLRDGELKMRLWGQKVRGEWTLVRTKNGSWLWLKKNDEWAEPSWDPEEHLWSVVSGRSFQEVRDGRSAPAARRRFPKGAVKAPLPSEVTPMLAEVAAPFDDRDWLFEVKWDGVRALAFCQEQSLRLSSRAGHSLSESFPELRYLRSRLAANSFVVDGELVVLDGGGRPEFHKILKRLRSSSARTIEAHARSTPAVYYLFDLLYLDGRDLRALPLEIRRRLLEEVLRPDPRVRLSEAIAAHGETLYQAAVQQGLEGLVAKHRGSPYQAGRSPHWRKLKSRHTLDGVVVGFTPSKAGAGLGALHLARYFGDELRLIGKVGSGFDATTLRELRAVFEPLATATPAAEDRRKVKEPITWVRPVRVVEVEYAELTPDGNVRQASFVRLRDDLDPSDCSDDPAPVARSFREVEGIRVAFSSPQKVLFPTLGVTKQQLADYYQQVAPLMLPHLAERPLSLRRYPDGVDGAEFFQKHPGPGIPEWLTTKTWEHGEAMLADSSAALTVFSNLAAVELHATLSRFPHLQRPDGVLIDFDPQSLSFPEVKKVAITAGQLLKELGWRSYLKTTGNRGLHVFIPIAPDYSFEQTRMMAGVIGHRLLELHPDTVTLERAPSKRPQKTVYIDAPQNRYTSTVACAYGVRANRFAGVSMPLAWEDLETDLVPEDFSLPRAACQAERTAALWSMLPDPNQRLEDAL